MLGGVTIGCASVVLLLASTSYSIKVTAARIFTVSPRRTLDEATAKAKQSRKATKQFSKKAKSYVLAPKAKNIEKLISKILKNFKNCYK